MLIVELNNKLLLNNKQPNNSYYSDFYKEQDSIQGINLQEDEKRANEGKKELYNIWQQTSSQWKKESWIHFLNHFPTYKKSAAYNFSRQKYGKLVIHVRITRLELKTV